MKTDKAHQNHTAATQLDRKVSNRMLAKYRHSMPEVLIRRALVEAREAAAESGWPLLVYPILAEETVGRVLQSTSASSLEMAAAA